MFLFFKIFGESQKKAQNSSLRVTKNDNIFIFKVANCGKMTVKMSKKSESFCKEYKCRWNVNEYGFLIHGLVILQTVDMLLHLFRTICYITEAEFWRDLCFRIEHATKQNKSMSIRMLLNTVSEKCDLWFSGVCTAKLGLSPSLVPKIWQIRLLNPRQLYSCLIV